MVGIPNLVCICSLGLPSGTYHFWVSVTLTSDLVFGIIMPEAFEIGIPNLVCLHLWMAKCRVPFAGHCDLTSDIGFRIFMSRAYLLY